MRKRPGLTGICFCLMYLLIGMPAARPQDQDRTWDLLRKSLSTGDRVRVVETSGNRVEGNVIEATASSLVLESRNNRLDVSISQIREVMRRDNDPLWNGILIGAGAGAGAGIITTVRECGTSDTECNVIAGPVFIGAGIGIGIAAGALIDRFTHKFRTVFTAPAGPGAPKFSVIPVIHRGETAVRFSLLF